MKIAIVSDSNSGIKETEAKELGFYILPTPILIDDVQYFQDINLTEEEFYEKLTTGHKVSTSQPNPYSAEKLWSYLLQTYDQIIYFPISSGLSQTCYNLQKVAEQNFKGKVFVIDNKRVSVAMRQSMMDAKKMADEGKTGEEIEKWLLDTRAYSSIYIMVDTLEYLKRSGRLNAPSAFFGTLLKIKPILQIQGESIGQYRKVTTLSKGKECMIDAVRNDLETRFKEPYEAGKMVVGVAHTQNLAEAEKLKEEMIQAFPKCEFVCLDDLNLSIAVHLGPGVLALGCAIRY